jgi:hypothetical protein
MTPFSPVIDFFPLSILTEPPIYKQDHVGFGGADSRFFKTTI